MTDIQSASTISALTAPTGDTTRSSFTDMATEATQDDLRTADTTLADDSQMETGGSVAETSGGVGKSIYLATYSSVAVFELMVRGIACMRRRSDGYINATQILKIAGIDKAKRTKILEKEILTGEHEKVQGGYGKYQGTWIPLKRAQELSATYLVAHLLQPLLEFDPSKAGSVPVAGKRKRPNPNAPAVSAFNRQSSGAPSGKGAGAKASPAPGPASTSIVSSSEILDPSSAGSSLQPRFISLRPPPGMTGPESMNGFLESSNLVFPRGTTAEQKETLSKYSSHGYTPQGIPLPNGKNAPVEGSGSKAKRGADSAFGEEEESGEAKRQRANGTGDESMIDSSFVLGPSPVKDLNALGRSTSPTSALRGARAPTRPHRIALGPPDVFRQMQLDGTRFADRPQIIAEGDEIGRRMRSRLLQLFVDDRLSQADVEDQSEQVTAQDERKLDGLLDELRAAAHPIEEGQAENATNSTHTNGHLIDSSAAPPCVDLVIDEHGHSALHWSAALAKISHVRFLCARSLSSGGANTNAGNHAGETALHRTVLVSNAYESSSFPALLHLLSPSLHTRDYRKRTILHHIALISSVKGRATSARYYLACLLEYIAKYQGGRYAALIDAQDDEGETALSIVARIGNMSMIKMLLDVGARRDIVNELGLKASDWGIDAVDSKEGAETSASGDGVPEATKEKPTEAVSALTRPPRAPVQKSKDVLEQMTTVLQDLADVFQKELTDKTEALTVAQAHLQSATRELALRRRRIAESQSHVAERDEARMRRRNIAKVIREHLLMMDESTHSTLESIDEEGWIAEFIATHNQDSMELDETEDAPFKDGEKEDELIRWRWLDGWYNDLLNSLQAKTDALDISGAEKMNQCKKVVAMCCGVQEDKMEGILDELMVATESIVTEGVDLQRLAGFLSKVKETRS